MGEPRIEVTWLAGYCPVQAEGTINGERFYFRARGQHWSIDVGGDDPVGSPTWSYEEPYGEGPFDAGWMDDDEAMEFIRVAAKRFAREQDDDREMARIENLSDDELDAELRSMGLDPTVIVAEGKKAVATAFWYDPRYPRMLESGTPD